MLPSGSNHAKPHGGSAMADSPNTTTAPEIPAPQSARAIVNELEDDIRAVLDHGEMLRLMAVGLRDLTDEELPADAFVRLAEAIQANGNRLQENFEKLDN